MHHNPKRCHSKPGQWEPGGNRGLGDQLLGEEDAAGPWTMLGRVRVWVTSKDLSRVLKQGSKRESNVCMPLGTLGCHLRKEGWGWVQGQVG